MGSKLKIDAGGKPAVMIFDFDGTITEEDIFDALFRRFADPACWEAHRAYHDRELSMKETYREMSRYFHASLPEIHRFLHDKARLRKGFKKLCGALDAAGIERMIVSNGFDLYLHYLVDLWDLDFTENQIFCHSAGIENGRFIPRFREHRNLSADNCLIGKAEIVREEREKGKFIIFAGNGFSDTPAAHDADLVVARQRLADYCRTKEIPFVPFSTFQEVTTHLFG